MKRWFKRLAKAVSGRTKVVVTKSHYRNLGDAARGRGDWDAASRHYAFHLEANPQDFGIWVQMGHALKERGLLDQSELAYARASRLDATNADLWLNRGHLAKLRRDYAAAREHYGLSYSIDRNTHAATELNGLDGLTQGDQGPTNALARSELQIALGLDPNRSLRPIEIYNGTGPDFWSAEAGGTAVASEARDSRMGVDRTERLRALEDENGRLKALLAQSVLDAAATRALSGQH